MVPPLLFQMQRACGTWIHRGCPADTFSERVSDMPELTDLKANLFEALMSSNTFEDLIQTASDLIRWPLIVIDPTFRILAHSSVEGITDVLWSEHVKRKFCDINFIVQFNQIPAVVQGIHQPKAFQVPCRYSTYPKLVCQLRYHAQCQGYVICLCQSTPEPKDFTSLELIASMLSFKWNLVLRKNPGGSGRAEILADLLNGSYQEDTDIKERLLLSHISFPSTMYLLAINISPDSPDSRLVASYFNYSKHLFDNDLFVYFQNYIVIFLPDQRLPTVIENLDRTQIPIGVSRPVSDIARCPKAFQEAKEALTLGRLASPGKNIYYYQNLVFYTLLKGIDPDAGIQEYCHPAIFALMEYDAKSQACLCETLFMFLLCDGSLQKISQEMFLHRNTISFRMNKISELLHLDLHDPELRHQLLTSFHILHFFQQKQKQLSGSEKLAQPG